MKAMGWRTSSTVVPHEAGGWVVRTWVAPEQGQSPPSRPPDFVHRVDFVGPTHDGSDSGVRKLHAEQVHPKPDPALSVERRTEKQE
jgi:hypothetical protein